MFGKSTIFTVELAKALGLKFHVALIHIEDQSGIFIILPGLTIQTKSGEPL